jgi:hypothetical protein
VLQPTTTTSMPLPRAHRPPRHRSRLQIAYESFEGRPRSAPKPEDHRTGVEGWFVHSSVFGSEGMPGGFESPQEG